MIKKMIIPFVLFAMALTLFPSISRGKVEKSIAVIVSSSWEEATSLTVEELKLIYLGKKRDFAGKRVKPRQRREGLSIRKGFISNVLNMNERNLKKYWLEEQFKRGARPPAESGSLMSVIDYVTSVDGAISYIDCSRLTGDDLGKLKILSIRKEGKEVKPGDPGYLLVY